MMLLDKEKEIDSMRKRGQEINRDSAQSTERLASVEKAVSTFSWVLCIGKMGMGWGLRGIKMV